MLSSLLALEVSFQGKEVEELEVASNMAFNPFTPWGDFRPNTKVFFKKIYSYFSFYAGEIYLETFFFFREREWFELFSCKHEKKKLKNQARNEICRQIPLTLTLMLDVK